MDNSKKPLIGLTTSHNIQTDETCQPPYCSRAILAAGGIPLILPLEASEADLRQLARTLDGFLFTGGPDLHPFLFGEETRAGCGEVSSKRDQMELALLRMVMEQKKPVMGICRGIQAINIGLGGSVYQDIPTQTERVYPIAHRQPFPPQVPAHTVKVVAGSRLAAILSGDPSACGEAAGGRMSAPAPAEEEAQGSAPLIVKVNSTHHQAVRDVAPGLTACAYAPDGIIEGLESDDGYPFLIAVQWHPEYLWQTDPAAANLFKAFVRASLCSQIS